MNRFIRKMMTILVCLTLLDTNGVLMTCSMSNAAPLTKNGELFDPALLIKPAFNQYARVDEISRSLTHETPFIIHFRDLHCNYEAQMNIAKALEYLWRENPNGELLVLVEGAVGDVDTSLFGSFPYDESKKDATASFVRKGKMTGPEYLSINRYGAIPIRIEGVEDEDLYIDNFETFRHVLKFAQDVKEFKSHIKEIIQELKTKTFSEALLELDQLQMQFDGGQLQLELHIHQISKYFESNKIDLGAEYPNLQRFTRVLEKNQDIDMNKVEKERNLLVEQLGGILGKEELGNLLKRSLEYRLGKISASEYFDYLWSQAGRLDDISEYQDLQQYIQIIKDQTNIDESELLGELTILTSLLVENAIESDEQNKLVDLSKRADIFGKLLSLELTRDDLLFMKEHQEEMRLENIVEDINDWIHRYQIGISLEDFSSLQMLREVSTQGQHFYEVAVQRDLVLVEKAIEKARSRHIKSAVLITGGFHSDGVTKIMKKRDIGYVVLTPRVLSEPNMENYYALMMDERIAQQTISWFSIFNPLAGKISPSLQLEELEALLDRFLEDARTQNMNVRILKRWLLGWLRQKQREGAEADPQMQSLISQMVTLLNALETRQANDHPLFTERQINQLVDLSPITAKLTIAVLQAVQDPLMAYGQERADLIIREQQSLQLEKEQEHLTSVLASRLMQWMRKQFRALSQMALSSLANIEAVLKRGFQKTTIDLLNKIDTGLLIDFLVEGKVPSLFKPFVLASLTNTAPNSDGDIVFNGKYGVEDFIGAGLHGSLFRVRDIATGQQMALKIGIEMNILETQAANIIIDLQNEGQSHPNMPSVYDQGVVTSRDGDLTHFIAMEYLEPIVSYRAGFDHEFEGLSAIDIIDLLNQYIAGADFLRTHGLDISQFAVVPKGDKYEIKFFDFSIWDERLLSLSELYGTVKNTMYGFLAVLGKVLDSQVEIPADEIDRMLDRINDIVEDKGQENLFAILSEVPTLVRGVLLNYRGRQDDAQQDILRFNNRTGLSLKHDEKGPGLWAAFREYAYPAEEDLLSPQKVTRIDEPYGFDGEATEKALSAPALNLKERSFVERLFKKSVKIAKREEREHIAETLQWLNTVRHDQSEAAIAFSDIVIHKVPTRHNLLGLPRSPGAVKMKDTIPAFGRREGDKKLHIYVTDRFWDEHLLTNKVLLAEIIDHEWYEIVEAPGLGIMKTNRHRQAAMRAWRIFARHANNDLMISEYHKLVIDQYANEEDFETLESMNREHRADRDNRILDYVREQLLDLYFWKVLDELSDPNRNFVFPTFEVIAEKMLEFLPWADRADVIRTLSRYSKKKGVINTILHTNERKDRAYWPASRVSKLIEDGRVMPALVVGRKSGRSKVYYVASKGLERYKSEIGLYAIGQLLPHDRIYQLNAIYESAAAIYNKDSALFKRALRRAFHVAQMDDIQIKPELAFAALLLEVPDMEMLTILSNVPPEVALQTENMVRDAQALLKRPPFVDYIQSDYLVQDYLDMIKTLVKSVEGVELLLAHQLARVEEEDAPQTLNFGEMVQVWASLSHDLNAQIAQVGKSGRVSKKKL
ncbi:MAG: hypothetical protein Q8Q33_09880, partial [Chlamydiota bacterium]|nr:hypothetical protein [Chlamydiota bacterium]